MLLLAHDTRAAGSRRILHGDLECAVTSVCPKYALLQLHAKGYSYRWRICRCRGAPSKWQRLSQGCKDCRDLPITGGLRDDTVTKKSCGGQPFERER